jgi:hypothetical protein
MTQLIDNSATQDAVMGVLRVESRKGSQQEFTMVGEDEKNLILNNASTLLRNIMFGDGTIITKIHFGDMNLTKTDNLVDVLPPALTDMALTRKLYEKDVTKEKGDYAGDPAIKYSVTLARNEFNGTGIQIITEYALASAAASLFSRKTKAAVFKDSETELRFTWWIVFK